MFKRVFIVLSAVVLFSGCDALDKMLEIKNNTETQIAEIQDTVTDIQTNIETKKAQLDEKIAQIQAVKTSLDELLGDDDLSVSEKTELQQLKIETEILEQAVVDLKDKSTDRLNDDSGYSIE